MKDILFLPIKDLYSNKTIALTINIMIVLLVIFVICAIVLIDQRDTQVVVNYTIYGKAHYTKDTWMLFYAIPFSALTIVVTNIVLMSKLMVRQRPVVAQMLGWVTVMLLLLALVYMLQITGLAFL